jgi:hypothetical protein
MAFKKMIFPVWTLQSVNRSFLMQYDQRVIIKFLWNEREDARKTAVRLQAEFGEHAYQLRTVQLWITEIRRGRQDLHDEIRNRRPPLGDLNPKFLTI